MRNYIEWEERNSKDCACGEEAVCLSTVNSGIRSEKFLPIAELFPHQNTCRGVKYFDSEESRRWKTTRFWI